MDLDSLPVRRQREVIAGKMPLLDRDIVDIGCGDGQLARWMAEQGARVTGIECSPAQLQKAAEAEPVSGCSVIEGVGQALPLGDGCADGVIFFNSLHHVPVAVMDAALQEAARILRVDGLLYVAEPVASGPRFEMSRPIDDETHVRDEALKALHRASEPGKAFVALEEYFYRYDSIVPDFEQWKETSIAISAERARIFEEQEADLRTHFESWGQWSEKGWLFPQPMRVNLYRRTE